MDFSIIIPTYERKDIFYKSLKNTLDVIQDYNSEIIVINDSANQKIEFSNPRVRIERNPKKGVASARNFGASMAKSDRLIFLDDDMLLTKPGVDKILEHLCKEEQSFYLLNWKYPHDLESSLKGEKFGRFMINHKLISLEGWLDEKWIDNSIFEVDMGASYCLPITKKNFDLIGGYNEGFPHAGAEDYDFFSRAKNLDFTIFIDSSITIFQNEEDRTDLKNWLLRKKRNGQTIRFAVELGYDQLAFNYNWIEKLIYKIASPIKGFIFFLYKLVPNVHIFDPLSHTLIKLLLGTHLYEGYYISQR